MNKSFVQVIWDFIGIPFRFVLFDQKWLPRFGWTTLEEERINTVLPFIKGELLDIGAGLNTLVKRYGRGFGVDVVDWGGDAIVVKNSANLPFDDASFDTVTFIACFNHIPNRDEVLKETRRLLKSDGTVIITMIDPILGKIGHAIWWYSEDKKRGGMVKGEMGGMWTEQILKICNTVGYKLIEHHHFELGMNHIYIFRQNLLDNE
jgi:SAM-dependent methyltransferase